MQKLSSLLPSQLPPSPRPPRWPGTSLTQCAAMTRMHHIRMSAPSITVAGGLEFSPTVRNSASSRSGPPPSFPSSMLTTNHRAPGKRSTRTKRSGLPGVIRPLLPISRTPAQIATLKITTAPETRRVAIWSMLSTLPPKSTLAPPAMPSARSLLSSFEC